MSLSSLLKKARNKIACAAAAAALGIGAAGSLGCGHAGRAYYHINSSTEDFDRSFAHGITVESRTGNWWYGFDADYYGAEYSERIGRKNFDTTSWFSYSIYGEEQSTRYRAEGAAYLDRTFAYADKKVELEARIGAGAALKFYPLTRYIMVENMETDYIPTLEIRADLFPQWSVGAVFKVMEHLGIVVGYRGRFMLLDKEFNNMMMLGIEFR